MPYISGPEDIERVLKEASIDDPESLNRLCRELLRQNYTDETVCKALRYIEYGQTVVEFEREIQNLDEELEAAVEIIENLRVAVYGSPKEKLEARKKQTFLEKGFNHRLKDWEGQG